MVDELHRENFHLMISIWPFFEPGSANYEFAETKGWFIDKFNDVFERVTGRYVGILKHIVSRRLVTFLMLAGRWLQLEVVERNRHFLLSAQDGFPDLSVADSGKKLPVAGRVIWMTPKGAQGKRTAGIGVQISEQDRGNTQRKIESYLAGALGGDKPTHTM